jgi:hypothetical protein
LLEEVRRAVKQQGQIPVQDLAGYIKQLFQTEMT